MKLVTAPRAARGKVDVIVDADRIESLRKMSGSGENVLEIMVGLFLRDTPARLDTLRTAAATGDGETLARTAHNLIGSSGNVGALRMVAVCRTIDREARAGDVSDAVALVERLATEYQLVEAALREQVSADAG